MGVLEAPGDRPAASRERGRARLLGTSRPASLRSEPRRELVRIVDYVVFPRLRSDREPQRGTTRNLSPSGLCLNVKTGEPVGSVLRLLVCGLDGRPTLETLGRVAWVRAGGSGGVQLGVSLLRDHHRRPRETQARQVRAPVPLR